MGSTDFIKYNRQIGLFLQSCTVAFTPLAGIINTNLRAQGYIIDDLLPETWKYYRNMVGEYHESDTPMSVVSLDTGEQIAFTKDNLIVHRKTAAAYRVGQPLHEELVAKHPNQENLIRCILFPVKDMETALQSKSLDLLAWGDGYLEADESVFIIDKVRKFLTYTRERWFTDYLGYEELFYQGFMVILAGHLFSTILAARISAIKTSEVHSFHIWEYLKSHDLDDYSDILSRKTSMWLYRNIDWILANRGKQDTLIKLADNLLADAGVALVARTINQQTLLGEEEGRWLPDFVAETVPTKYAGSISNIAPQSTDNILSRIAALGLDEPLSFDRVNQVEYQLGATGINTMNTKFLELHPLPIDRKYADLLVQFTVDLLVKMLTTGKYQTTVNVIDPLTGQRLRLKDKAILAALYWCLHRSYDSVPTHLPDTYSPKHTYKFDVSLLSIPEKIRYENHWYRLDQLFDTRGFIAGATYPWLTITTPEEMSDLLLEHFEVFIKQTKMMRMNSEHVASLAMNKVFQNITDWTPYGISLSTHETYVDWFSSEESDSLSRISSVIDTVSNYREMYNRLANAILDQVVPMTEGLAKYAADVVTDQFYERMKKLFVQLCSYNVLFLDKSRDKQIWLWLTKLTLYVLQNRVSEEHFIEIGTSYPYWQKDHSRVEYDLPLTTDCHITHRTKILDLIKAGGSFDVVDITRDIVSVFSESGVIITDKPIVHHQDLSVGVSFSVTDQE